MKRIKTLLISLALLFGMGGGMLVPVIAHADTAKSEVCQTLQAGANCTDDKSGSVSVSSIVTTTINVLSLIIGVIAVIMIIIAGIRYVVSAGDSNAVSGAKNTLIYALVGLVVAALAQVLVQFVLKKITNS